MKIKNIIKKYKDSAKQNEISSNSTLAMMMISPEEKLILEEKVKEFFPETGHWNSICFKKSKELSRCNLPCHLRNYKWLAKLIKQYYELDIPRNKIELFLKTSEIFEEERHNYEQKIVKWQIEYMKNGGEGWLAESDFILMTDHCDIGFRNGIVNTLKAIGIDEEAIEKGIETNASLWRDFYMESAFYNKYDHIWGAYFRDPDAVLEPVDPEFKEKWLQLRKYEYYQDHKSSVDKYGVVEVEMTQKELEILRYQIQLFHNKRLQQLENYNNLSRKRAKV